MANTVHHSCTAITERETYADSPSKSATAGSLQRLGRLGAGEVLAATFVSLVPAHSDCRPHGPLFQVGDPRSDTIGAPPALLKLPAVAAVSAAWRPAASSRGRVMPPQGLHLHLHLHPGLFADVCYHTSSAIARSSRVLACSSPVLAP